MKMEELMLRFPHLPEQIFQKLDNSSLFKCREVVRSWKNLIDGKNYTWLRVVNIPTILKKKNTYLHLAAETGQIEAFKIASNKKKNINIKNRCGETSFHLACKKGCSMIVQFILKKINGQTTNVNSKEINDIDGLDLACVNGHSEVVKILMDNAIDLGMSGNWKDRVMVSIELLFPQIWSEMHMHDIMAKPQIILFEDCVYEKPLSEDQGYTRDM